MYPSTHVDDEGAVLGGWRRKIENNTIKLKTFGMNGNQVERLARIGIVLNNV